MEETNDILQAAPLETGQRGPPCNQGRHYVQFFDYLNMEELLISDGFVRFRLWKYSPALPSAPDQNSRADSIRLVALGSPGVHRLLKSFVELQEPWIDIVHVIVQAKRASYCILDWEFLPH